MKSKTILCGLVCLCLLSGCSGKPGQTPTGEPETTTAISKQTNAATEEVPATTAVTEEVQTEPTVTKTEAPTKAPTQPPTKAPEKQTGTVKGCITYQYNKTIGTKGDVGADILLIPIDLPDGSLTRINAIAFTDFPDNCKHVKADGNGNYSIQNVPAGRYVIAIRSKNTRCKGNTEASVLPFSLYFNEEGKARLIEGFENYKSNWVTVTGGEDTVFSHDFGYTYF